MPTNETKADPLAELEAEVEAGAVELEARIRAEALSLSDKQKRADIKRWNAERKRKRSPA